MDAKLQLSAEEMRLVTDPAWILTKNSVVRKAVEMLSELSGEWRDVFRSETGVAGSGAAETEPKISKGEQYKGLPWVMLDYPRVFGKEDVMAIRTMFWWGHCFSITLHLKGRYLRTYIPVILARLAELEAAGFSPGTSADEWEHEHNPGSWDKLGSGTSDSMAERPFAKFTANIGLDRWNEASTILTEKFAVLARILVTT